MGTTQNNMLTKVIFTAAVATSVQAGILNDLKNKAENVGSNIGTGVPNLQHIKPATGSVTGSATGSVTGSATGSVTGSQPIMQTGSANLGTGISNHQHTKPATEVNQTSQLEKESIMSLKQSRRSVKSLEVILFQRN